MADSELTASNAPPSPSPPIRSPKAPPSPTSSDSSDNDLHYVRRLSDPGEVPYRSSPRPLYLLTVLSAVGGFLFGYDTGVVSGAMILVRPVSHLHGPLAHFVFMHLSTQDNIFKRVIHLIQEFKLSDFWHELIVASTVFSAFAFALVAGDLSAKFGRRPTILAASVTFTIGAFVMGMAAGKCTVCVAAPRKSPRLPSNNGILQICFCWAASLWASASASRGSNTNAVF